ncbi:MAG: Xaa-Pro peptidase family protein [Dehalococcoidia bacterium]
MNIVKELSKGPIPKELAFSEAEYAERVERVRKLMAEAGLDVLVCTSTPNKCYLTGYDTVMPSGYSTLILPLEGEPVMHLPEIDVPSALKTSWVKGFIIFDWAHAQDTGTDLARALKERGFHNKRIGLEMGHGEIWSNSAMDVRSYLRLKELLPEAQFQDATNLVLQVRIIKSPAELDCMRKAGEITAKGYQAAISETAAGKKDNDIAKAVYAAMLGAGSEPLSIQPLIMSGHRTGWVTHLIFRRVSLKVGDSIYLEFSGVYNRYNAPQMRTIVIGEPSDLVRRLADASLTTVNLLLENIKPGCTGHEIAQVAKKGLAPMESVAYFHGGFGYAIGLGFPPTWTEAPVYIAEGEERPLQPGMTFHLPICIQALGQCGVSFSESVVVTETGCDLLTQGDGRELTVVPA